MRWIGKNERAGTLVVEEEKEEEEGAEKFDPYHDANSVVKQLFSCCEGLRS